MNTFSSMLSEDAASQELLDAACEVADLRVDGLRTVVNGGVGRILDAYDHYENLSDVNPTGELFFD